MNRYFDSFNLIKYNNATAVDITERAAILSTVFGDNFAFYPYQVKNGMRADQVAERYYGDATLEWLVYYSNNIVDPYYEWPMSDETFLANINSIYGSVPNAINKIVKYRVNWYEDTRELSASAYNSLFEYEKKYWTPEFDVNNYPLHYVRKEIDFLAVAQDGNGNITLSIPAQEQSYWSPVTAYDIELEANANKANIRLLDSRLASVAATNLRQLLTV